MEYNISPFNSKKPVHIFLPFGNYVQEKLEIERNNHPMLKINKRKFPNIDRESYDLKNIFEIENSMYFKLHKVSFIENLNNSLNKSNLSQNSHLTFKDVIINKDNKSKYKLPSNFRQNFQFFLK